MQRLEIFSNVHGLKFHDEWTIYPCRHIHFKWSIDGKGPKKSRRLKKGSVHYERMKQVIEEMNNHG